MLAAVSSLSNTNKDDKQGEMASFTMETQEFPDFSDTNLLESIDFDDLFEGINDVLPDLEMDPEIIPAEFSVSGGDANQESEMKASISVENKVEDNIKKEDEDKVSSSSSGSGSGFGSRLGLESSLSKGEEIVSKKEKSPSLKTLPKEDKGRKSSSQTKNNNNNNQGKRKAKVDWTPELHRRFVQAVEQLGVDKAVPSRILELMGIDCLTRHNIASHLQKYRSHRKHLLAREAEAASWGQRRQRYGAAAAITTAGGGGKRDMNLWVAPTMGFPPMRPPPPMHPHHHHHFRPLHVWGHPTMDQSLMHMWPPKPVPTPAPAPPSWAQPHPPPHWHGQHRQQVSPLTNGVTPGTPCCLQPMTTTTRFPAPPVTGIPPYHHHHNAMYRVQPPGVGVPTTQSGLHPLIDCHPSKESIDAAIGDVLSKPWLPLPLGLKPPSIDSVMGELQRQGVPKVPPSCA